MAKSAEILSTSPAAIAPERKRLAAANFLLGSGMALQTAAGCLGILPEIETLWKFWTTDPLRSIGILIPPVSILLTLRVWRQAGWELRGTWWGLPVIGLAFFLSILRQRIMLFGAAGSAMISFIPVSLPVYVYGSGVVLLFAGMRVWRRAWFPIGLLLLCQPVPILSNGLIDIPLQNLSARVARSFATLIGFAPATSELRLMFSPNFGMFIAPGCDGIRGAVTMGYVALVLGYLKRVPALVWAAWVAGAVLLGYLFNFIRLCVLVVYYRLAVGSATLEGMAKWVDYAIGSCLFLAATLLFVHLARRKTVEHERRDKALSSGGSRSEPIHGPAQFGDHPSEAKARFSSAPGCTAKAVPFQIRLDATGSRHSVRAMALRCAGFAVVLVLALAPPTSALRQAESGAAKTAPVTGQMPRQVGNFKLGRTWFEQQDGITVVENGAYAASGSDEIVLGVWIAPLFNFHDVNACWLTRGLQPDSLASRQFAAGGGESAPLNVGYYSDGVTDSILVNAFCTPASCSEYQRAASVRRIGFLILEPQLREFRGTGPHPVSIMIRIDKLHGTAPKNENYNVLSSEAEKFVAGLDLRSLSKEFQ